MSNVIYLDNFSSYDTTPQLHSDISRRKFARALLLKLNAPKDGDIATILKPTSDQTDLECVLRWLTDSIDHVAIPLDLDQCYELLCSELNDRLRSP